MLIAVNGLKYHLEMAGQGPPLLLLHGFTGSTENWQPLLPAFRSQYQVIRLDLIGHGLTESPQEYQQYSMDQAVEDIILLLDHVGLEKINLLGYSMGGRLALLLAVKHPKRLQTLIIESGSPGLVRKSERATRRVADEDLARFIEHQGMAAFVDKWTAIPLFKTQLQLTDTIKNAVRRQRLQNNIQGLAHSLRGMGTGVQQSLWSSLPKVAVPTLLLVGALDPKFEQLGISMAKAIPHSILQVVENAGHTIHLEQPERFAQAVQNFLSLYPHESTDY